MPAGVVAYQNIIDVFQFVEKTFSKKTTIDKQSVVDMFNDIPLFRGESKLVSLANDGLSALTAVVYSATRKLCII